MNSQVVCEISDDRLVFAIVACNHGHVTAGRQC